MGIALHFKSKSTISYCINWRKVCIENKSLLEQLKLAIYQVQGHNLVGYDLELELDRITCNIIIPFIIFLSHVIQMTLKLDLK